MGRHRRRRRRGRTLALALRGRVVLGHVVHRHVLQLRTVDLRREIRFSESWTWALTFVIRAAGVWHSGTWLTAVSSSSASLICRGLMCHNCCRLVRDIKLTEDGVHVPRYVIDRVPPATPGSSADAASVTKRRVPNAQSMPHTRLRYCWAVRQAAHSAALQADPRPGRLQGFKHTEARRPPHQTYSGVSPPLVRFVGHISIASSRTLNPKPSPPASQGSRG